MASSHRRHHFVPQFYLENWVGADGKLACYRWMRSRVIVSRLGPRNVAYREGLYTLPQAPEHQRQSIEKEFFAPIDERAAKVHRQLVTVGTTTLSMQDRTDWAVFLLSLRVRTPESVERIRADATAELLQVLDRDPEQWNQLRKAGDPSTLREWVQQNMPAMIENYGTSIVPQLIMDYRPLRHIVSMHWWTTRLSGASEFLTSDHPCVYTHGYGNPNCVIALPLTPTVVFYAANRPELEADFNARSSQTIAIRTNENVVSQAFEYVFAVGGNRKLFVSKHLQRAPSRPRTR
jgi:hypothetical protein